MLQRLKVHAVPYSSTAKNGGTDSKYIAGSVGPTNKTASLSPDVNNPGFRAVSFDDLRACYFRTMRGACRRWGGCIID